MVEAKAARIKEWVTNKLRDLEAQNQHLREQNHKCNQQLELLRRHMAQLSADKMAVSACAGTSSPRTSTSSLHRANSTGSTQWVLLHHRPEFCWFISIQLYCMYCFYIAPYPITNRFTLKSTVTTKLGRRNGHSAHIVGTCPLASKCRPSSPPTEQTFLSTSSWSTIWQPPQIRSTWTRLDVCI